MDATTPMNFTLLSKSRSALNRRSTPSAPTALRFTSTGTQTKLSSSRPNSPLGRTMQEVGLPADARYDDRLAAFDDPAGDAFADAVPDGLRRFVEAVGRFNGQLAVLAEQGDHAPDGAVALAQDLEDAVQR